MRAVFPGNIARLSQSAAVLVMGIVVAWIIAQGWYAVASADDFCFAGKVRQGVFQTVFNDYFGWDGRYTSTLLIGWFVSHHDLLTRYYFVCPFIIIAANYAASYWFLKKNGLGCRYLQVVFFTVLISAYSLNETVFWLSGGFSYGLACALFIALIGEEFAVFSSGAISNKRTGALCSGAFVLAGFNETVMIAHMALLSILLGHCILHKSKAIRAFALILLVAGIGAVIVYVAPGNAIRSIHMPQRFILPAIMNSFYWVFGEYALFLLLTLVLFYYALLLFLPKINAAALNKPIIWYNLALFFALWGSAFTRFYTENTGGPDRTHIVDIVLVTVLAFMMALHLYRKNNAPSRQAPAWLPCAMAAGLIVTFLIRPVMEPFTFTYAFTDIKSAAALHRYTNARYDTIRSVPIGTTLVFADYPQKKAAITYFDDITADHGAWQNFCFASYYRLRNVEVEKIPKPKIDTPM